jgi:hypothetical protein
MFTELCKWLWQKKLSKQLTLLAPSNMFFGNTIVEPHFVTSYYYFQMINCVEKYLLRKYESENGLKLP